jgi:hypothetical protein
MAIVALNNTSHVGLLACGPSFFCRRRRMEMHGTPGTSVGMFKRLDADRMGSGLRFSEEWDGLARCSPEISL